eukprot:g48228.t1
MRRALHLKKMVSQPLLEPRKLAPDKVDLCDSLEAHDLDEQVQAIKKLGDFVINLVRMGAPQDDMVEYLFDKHTWENAAKRSTTWKP